MAYSGGAGKNKLLVQGYWAGTRQVGVQVELGSNAYQGLMQIPGGQVPAQFLSAHPREEGTLLLGPVQICCLEFPPWVLEIHPVGPLALLAPSL